MAKIAYGAAVSNIRGKVSGTIFSKSRSGPTLKAYAVPKNPRTQAQTTSRSNFARASAQYAALTQTQKDGWADYAAGLTYTDHVSGETYTPTGSNVFTGLASKFLQVNPAGTIPVATPPSHFTGDTVTVTATGGSGKLIFTANAANTEGVTTEILLQKLRSAGRTPAPDGYRTKQFNVFATGSLVLNVTLSSGYYAAAIRFVNRTTGQETPPVALGSFHVL